MANKVKYGLRNVYYAPITAESASGYTYDDPVAIAGAVNLTMGAEGDSTEFYADDVVYFSSFANNGYSGELELALIPDDFLETILGETKDSNGAYIENADAVSKPFALGFEVQGDDKPRRMWYYNCTVSRPSQDAATKQASKEPQTDTLELKAMPRLSDHNVKVRMTKSATNETAFNGFFTEVYEGTTSV